MDNQDLLQSAIVKVKNKLIPAMTPQGFVPEDAYKQIFTMLDVWDSQREDPDIQERTKIVYEYLNRDGRPRDALLHILTKMGAVPPLENRLDRVYKYVKLQQQSDKIMRHYEVIQKNINALSDNR